MVHPHGELIRRLYATRARGDQAHVRAILADDVVWHEPGDAYRAGLVILLQGVVLLLAVRKPATPHPG